MNKKLAKEIAEKITNEELQDMFNAAKIGITDWTVVSNVNKGMSKGSAWNILASDFDVNQKYHPIAKTNMIREFGDFLSESFKPVKKVKVKINVVHQEPKFSDKLTKEEYEQLKEQHEQACKISDYSKMIMMGDENHKKMKEYESLTCKHTRITSHQGGQIDECLDCGKTWG